MFQLNEVKMYIYSLFCCPQVAEKHFNTALSIFMAQMKKRFYPYACEYVKDFYYFYLQLSIAFKEFTDSLI